MDITALNVQYEDVQETSRAAGPHAPEVTVTESSPMTAEPRVLAGRDSPDGVRYTPASVGIGGSCSPQYIPVCMR